MSRPRSSGPWRVRDVSMASFKCYGAPPTVYTLDDSLVTCILGPNGSGKSALLEALCFALGAPPSTLRVRQLNEVRCEVKVRLSRGVGGEVHEVEAALHEGSRVFRVDGRTRTAAQLRAFLREGGLAVGDTTVLRQAQVTVFADTNAPSAIADVVAAASGLARRAWERGVGPIEGWREESKAAADEVKRARRALEGARVDVGRLQAAADADAARAAASRRAAELDVAATDALGRMQRALVRLRRALQRRRAASEEAGRGAGAAAAAAHEAAARASREAQDVEARVRAADEGGSGDRSEGPELDAGMSGDRAVGAAEEREVEAARSALAEAQSAVDAVRRAEVAVASSEAALAAMRAAQSAREQESLQLRQAAAEVEWGPAGVDVLASQLGSLRAQLARAEARLSAAAHSRAAAEDQLRNLEATADAARCAADDANVGSGASGGGCSDDVRGQLRRVDTEALAAQRAAADARDGARVATEAAAGPWAALCSGVSGSEQGAYALGDCLRFRDACDPALPGLLRALAAVCPPSALEVVLVPDAAAATALLKRHRRAGRRAGSGPTLRIWQLDRLAPHDPRAMQRTAQAALGGPACVVLPLDMFTWPAAIEPAVLRALGGAVIASDAAAASELASHHGLAAATPDGSLSRRGSVAGGWDGGSAGRHAAARWAALLRRQAATGEAAAAEAAAARAMAMHDDLQRRIEDTERSAAVCDARRAELRSAADACAAEASAAAVRVRDAQAAENELQERVDSLRLGVEEFSALVGPAACAPCSSTAGGAAAKPDDLKRLQAAVATAEARAAAFAEKAEQAEAEHLEALSALEVARVRLSALPDIAELAARLHAAEMAAAGARGHAAADAEIRSKVAALVMVLREQAAELGAHAEAQAAEAVRMEAKQKAAEQRADADRTALEGVVARLDELRAQWAHHPGWLQDKTLGRDDGGGDACGSGDEGSSSGDEGGAATDSTPAGLTALEARLRQLRGRLARLVGSTAAPAPAGEALAARARNACVAEVSGLVSQLEGCIASLEGEVARGAEGVAAANDAVADEVAGAFRAMASSLLPGLELGLRREGRRAHDGLRIWFRKHTAMGSAATSSWSADLSPLSGGQRTLVSLALLLAVARAAGPSGGGGLLVLDEADAALDEHNQRCVAELLVQLARDGPAQVLCVSHNSAFQAACDGTLHVGAGGPAPGGAGGGLGGVAAGAKALRRIGGVNDRPSAASGAAGGGAHGGTKAKRARVQFRIA